MRWLMRWVGLAILLALLSGCQTLSGLESPEVHLANIQIDSASLFEQHWRVTLDVRNPNNRSVTLQSIDYKLYVNGEKFASGMGAKSVTLPAMGSATVETQLTTSLLTTLGQLQGLSQGEGKPLKYEIKGKASLGGLPLPLHFDHKGNFSLPTAN